MMNSLEFLKIDLKGLKEEETSLELSLENDFFKALDGAEVKQGSLHVSVSIRKASGFFELLFHTKGYVVIPCDRCLDDMEQPVETDNRLIVKFGSSYSEEDDIIVIRHVHAPGKCNPAMTKALEELSADRSSDEESDQEIDPRWEKLKNLKV